MNKKFNFDYLSDEEIMDLLFKEAMLDAIDLVIDDMDEYPEATAIVERIKIISKKY